MKTQRITLGLIACFFLFALVSSVSAASISLSPSTLTFHYQNQTQYFTIQNNGTDTVNISLPSTASIQGSKFKTLSTKVPELTQGDSASVGINLTSLSIKNLDFGSTVSTNLAISAVNSTNSSIKESKTLKLNVVKGFCDTASGQDQLKITDVNIDNNGAGEDDDWKPLDQIQVQVDVENEGSNTIHDVDVELGLFKENSNVAGDLDFSNGHDEKADIGSLDEDDRETVTFEFTVPADFDDDNYKLAIRAYSEDDDEGHICTDTYSGFDDSNNNLYKSISVSKQDDDGKLIAFSNLQTTPSQVTCGDTVTLNADMYNVGSDDQDKVKVILLNPTLNISETQVFNNLDEGDHRAISFQFQVPQNTKDGTYNIGLSANYNYNDYDENYRDTSDEQTLVPFQVIGCQISQQNPVSISASLSSTAEEGQPLTITATLTNLQSQQQTYVITPTSYSSWASLQSGAETSLTIQPGQTRTVTLTFNVKNDTAGQQTFVLEALNSGTGKVTSQSIAVNIQKSQEENNGNGVFNFSDNNWILWILVGINVILILVVLIVAIVVSRRR